MKQLVALITLALSLSVLAGCGTGLTGTAATGGGQATGSVALSGTVHGGSQPIGGASIQLWTVGTSGYGSTGSVVTSTTSATDGTGSYKLPSYTCSPANELVYLTATGGIATANTVNNQIQLMTALGPCSGLSPTQKVEIDEATTVVSVYALAQFMAASGSVGSYSTGTVGITNAFATVNNLISTSTGAVLAYTPGGNGLVPTAELNTLANILAYCVNSTGGTGSGTNCGKLFTDTTVNSVVPSNTLQAALNVALNPVNGSIYSLVSSTGPFQPTLSSAPNDWSVAVMYGGTYPGTTGVAIDASGNVWTAAAGGSNNGAVIELTPVGAVAANNPHFAGVDGFTGIAVDLGGNAWTSNNKTALIREFFQGGASFAGPFQAQETSSPNGIAVDLNNNIWVANKAGNTVSKFSNQGGTSAPISPSGGYTGGSLSLPTGVATDASGNAWVTDASGASLTKITSGGSLSGYSGSSLSGASGIAVDLSGDLWVTNSGNSSVVEFNGSGTQTTVASPGGSLTSGGTLNAVDGANHIWVANASSGTLSEFNSSGTVLSPTTGLQGAPVATSTYTGTALKQPYAVAVDLSGNVWVSNQNPPQIASNLSAGVTEFIGLGAPTIQPLALAAQQGLIGKPPGTSPGTNLLVGPSGLPSGVTGAKYNYQLLATGGNGSGYTWNAYYNNSALTSAGLTLSSSGLLSGTLIGTANAVQIGLQVTDSSGSYSTGVRTLTITTPAALSITTSSIASATVGTNYSQTFAATGGSGSYTWSIPNQTQLNALNAVGIGSAASGKISGTPTGTGSIPFTIQVTDLATGATASAGYTLTINAATLSQCTHDGSGTALLNGSYAFSLGGFDPNGHYYDQIGAFTANGAGTISGGVGDAFGDNTLSQFSNGELQYTFSGTYSIGSTDDRGIMTVSNSNTANTKLPSTSIYCFAADTITSGVASSGRIIEADGTGYIQTGSFQIQNTANFSAAALTSGYAFGVAGVSNPPNRSSVVGQITLNGSGGVSSGQLDYASASSNNSSESYSQAVPILTTSTYTMGANGRGTLTINTSQGSVSFITYEFGSNSLFLLSTAITNNTNLLLGSATPQTLTTFTSANIKGSGVFRSDGAPSATADDMQVGVLTYNGSGTITLIADENGQGIITTPSAVQSANYAVSSLGYVTISGAGSNTVNFYLYAPGGGYGTSSSNEVDFWTMVPQTVPSGGFTSASLSGAYSAGTVPTASYSTSGAGTSGGQAYPQVADLWLSFGSGTLSYTQDQNQAPGTTPYVSTGQTGSTTWALDGTYGAAYGRFTTNGGPMGYIVSPTQIILLQESSGKNGQLFNAVHH